MTLALVSEDQDGNQGRDSALMAWRAVNPDSLPIEWPLFSALLCRALLSGDESYSERDVLCSLLMGQSQLWSYSAPIEDPISICITEIVTFPRQRKCLVRYIAGEWQPFVDHFDKLLVYAQSQACQRIEAYLRKGFMRKLPPDWKVRHVLMVRNI